jgi:hypothetical protein
MGEFYIMEKWRGMSTKPNNVNNLEEKEVTINAHPTK